jgi:hypothetical protein
MSINNKNYFSADVDAVHTPLMQFFVSQRSFSCGLEYENLPVRKYNRLVIKAMNNKSKSFLLDTRPL